MGRARPMAGDRPVSPAGLGPGGRKVGFVVPPDLDAEISASVETYPDGRLKALVDECAPDVGPLAIKYVPARYAGTYRTGAGQLKISNTPGFTWGTGTYVAPLAFPVSSAIFGRIGIVCRFDPTGWRVFDATSRQNEELYTRWATLQPLFRYVLLTAQSGYYNQQLRDFFRTRYGIDCVLFPPDQLNAVYTRNSDVWMNVTDWKNGGIDDEYSDRLSDPWICVIADEEFEDDMGGSVRKALLGLTTDQLARSRLTQQIAQFYSQRRGLLRIRA